MSKLEIVAALQEIGLLLRVKAKDPFRARAYARAAQSIADFAGDLNALIAQKRLTELKGIGSSVASVVEDLHNTGTSSVLQKLKDELPPGALTLSQIAGLSLKKIRQLHESLGITNINDLKAALAAGKVRDVPGFGLKTEKSLLAKLSGDEKKNSELLLIHALRVADKLIAHMRLSPDVMEIDVAGDVRRWKESVSSIPIIGSTTQAKEVIRHFAEFPSIAQVEYQTNNSAAAQLIDGAKIEIYVTSPTEYWNLLHFATGSLSHVKHLQTLADQMKLELTPTRLGEAGGRKQLSVTQEEDIYEHLNMQYIPPELREDQGEIEAALTNRLPGNLIALDDIRGATHCHTVYSDGRNSVEEMALAAEAKGMKYITITDHSPSAFYARGVKLDLLKRQWEEIDKVQERVSIRILKGTESDILRDGELDYPDRILEEFDIIIASIHSRFSLDEDGMTRRIINAMKNPFFKIWGHPLGRLINRRPAISCRVEEVLDVIAESGAAIEINGDPHRLDLEPRWIREARKRSIKFVISTDAHSISDLNNLKFGVGIARRGWVRRSDVLNTLGAKAFQNAVKPSAR